MELNCNVCGVRSELEFPYGEDVVCPYCGGIYETDWDWEVDDEGRETKRAWIVSGG